MKKIVVFGGGTSHGMWDTRGGWSERLRNDLYTDTINSVGTHYTELYNLGIRGDSASELLDRFEREFKERNRHGEAETAVIIQVGANDAQFVYEEDDVATDPELFREQIEELNEKALEHADHVYFLGLNGVNEEDMNPIPGDIEGRSFSTNRMKQYTEIIREVTKDSDATFIPLMKDFTDDMLKDGLHPNHKGHELIEKKVRKKLKSDGFL